MKFNKKKFLLRALLSGFLFLTIAAVSFIVFTAIKTVVNYRQLSPTFNNPIVEKINKKPGLPIRLIITSIKIDVSIEYVGLTSDDVMDVGPNANVVGWYMLGPRPGDKGSAVIAGHYGWTDGRPAVFNHIQNLNKGDELSVIDQKGESYTFVVREIQKYDPESDATDVFHSDDGGSHLNLITCNGVWESDQQSYSDRLVVFTDKK